MRKNSRSSVSLCSDGKILLEIWFSAKIGEKFVKEDDIGCKKQGHQRIAEKEEKLEIKEEETHWLGPLGDSSLT